MRKGVRILVAGLSDTLDAKFDVWPLRQAIVDKVKEVFSLEEENIFVHFLFEREGMESEMVSIDISGIPLSWEMMKDIGAGVDVLGKCAEEIIRAADGPLAGVRTMCTITPMAKYQGVAVLVPEGKESSKEYSGSAFGDD